MRNIIPAAAILLVGTAVAAPAQETEHYTIERTENGYVRMDTRTGQISTCTESNGQLVCRLATEERQAYQDEIDSLQSRLDALEDRIAALEEGGAAAKSEDLPSDEEVEKTLGLMERFFRRFMDIARDLEREFRQEEEPAPPTQDRT
ncbi:hypothetical protein L598_001200000300 [Mesorhizobium sp. J18]|uniref:hypothetical protein n=1 Tax=Mesorhizobium sp. J18 TaxID=935263 RepID=UPI001199915C|nr:hypothetical protein [Mesorhizobium sp. J18]TWG99898.1 hypothetical protein L598_001200000300 [Mesorhizobium sp. J18]